MLPLPQLDSTAIEAFARETGATELATFSAEAVKPRFECIWQDAHTVVKAKLAEAYDKEDYVACGALAGTMEQLDAIKPDTFLETLTNPNTAEVAGTMVDQLTAMNPTDAAVEFRTFSLEGAGAKKQRLR